MASYNRVILVGNLTRDPEVTTFNSGGSVAKFGIAVNQDYKDKNGQKVEKAMFIDVEVWNRGATGKQADVAAQYLAKGKQVLIDGELELQTWQDKNDGSKRYKHSVKCERFVMLGKKGDDDSGGGGSGEDHDDRPAPPPRKAAPPPPARKSPPVQSYAPDESDDPFGGSNDDIPF